MASEIFAPFPGITGSPGVSFEQMVRSLCENDEYSRALMLCLQTLKTSLLHESLDSSFIMNVIINLRQHIPPPQFEEIVNQFNMNPGCFVRPNPDDIGIHKETIDDFLASLTQVVLEAVEQPENEKETAELRSTVRKILSQLPINPPGHLDIREYMRLLAAIIDGNDYRKCRKRMSRHFRRLFDRVKAGKPYRKKKTIISKLLKLAREIYGP